MTTPTNFILIEANQLEGPTLETIATEFVLREGTDYGAQEISLEKKVQQVLRQISNNEVRIVFDPESESLNLVTDASYRRDFSQK